jgi:tetratricopeptide (TPR) repeat protein
MQVPWKPSKPVKVFFSYSHKDEELRDELTKHLSILKRQQVIAEWYDRKIGAGREWEGEIHRQLDQAQIILLLISADFITSDYCYDVEVRRAMERHTSGTARVIPVILRPVVWQRAPFDKLNVLPKNARPVTMWPNRDEAFEAITRGLEAVVTELEIEYWLTRFREVKWDNPNAAIAYGERILTLQPDHPVRQDTAGLYYKRGHNKWWAAHEEAGQDIVASYLSQKQYEEVLADYNRALKLCPDEPRYYAARGRLHAETRADKKGTREPFDYNRALGDYTRAIELDPQNGEYYLDRARLNDWDRTVTLGSLMLLLRPQGVRDEDPENRQRKLQAKQDFQCAVELGYADEKTGRPKRKL